jgi:hypothetical protein
MDLESGKPDEIIFPNNCILHSDQCNFLWSTSWMSLVSSTYGMYMGVYDIASTTGLIFLSSINYWHKPDYSWRRYLDTGIVYFGLTYHVIRAYNSQYAIYYYSGITFSCLMFPLGIYFYKKKQFWKSTISNSALHIVANLSNMLLYSGYIEPYYLNPVFVYLKKLLL